MSNHKEIKKKSSWTWIGPMVGSIFIGWIGGKILDRSHAKLADFWTAAPDWFLFWIVVPALLLASVCCLWALKHKTDQVSELMAFPNPDAARHSGLIERLETLNDDLSSQELRDTMGKLAKWITILANGFHILLGLAIGLVIFLLPHLFG